MLYEDSLKQSMLDILHERVSGISDSIALIASEGFIPNKKKHNILYWSSILIHAYENIDVLSKEQQDKLDSLYNKILRA